MHGRVRAGVQDHLGTADDICADCNCRKGHLFSTRRVFSIEISDLFNYLSELIRNRSESVAICGQAGEIGHRFDAALETSELIVVQFQIFLRL